MEKENTQATPDWNDAPLESLLEAPVHEMSPEELASFVKRCALLRSSAQSQKAALKKEESGMGHVKEKKGKSAPKSSVDQAMELLASLMQP